MNIVVYCSSQEGLEEKYQRLASELGLWIGRHGHTLLYGGSNAAIHEWLGSPLVYRRQGPLLELLRKHASTVFAPIAGWHHYRSLVAGMLQKDPDPRARTVKRWMYILR